MDKVDCVVVGAGVVGLAIARALAAEGREVIVVEQAEHFGSETSSRNSEVIHAGLYYPPGSLKARLCVQGRDMLYDYARAKGVAHQPMGKLIVAVSEDELSALAHYTQQAKACGAGELRSLGPSEVAELEPEIVCAGALLSPMTGTIDSHEFMLNLVADIEANQGLIALRTRFERAQVQKHSLVVSLSGDKPMELECRLLINSAGLAAQQVAQAVSGLSTEFIPECFFAVGHYYNLLGRSPFGRLIYPIAEAGGLGIHVTLDAAGQARFGPDVRWIKAVDYNFDDSKRALFIGAIRRYYPGIDSRELVPGYTGIRPKIVGPGEPAADFVIQHQRDHGIRGLINLFGIESPGLTAALAIGQYTTALVKEQSLFT